MAGEADGDVNRGRDSAALPPMIHPAGEVEEKSPGMDLERMVCARHTVISLPSDVFILRILVDIRLRRLNHLSSTILSAVAFIPV